MLNAIVVGSTLGFEQAIANGPVTPSQRYDQFYSATYTIGNASFSANGVEIGSSLLSPYAVSSDVEADLSLMFKAYYLDKSKPLLQYAATLAATEVMLKAYIIP